MQTASPESTEEAVCMMSGKEVIRKRVHHRECHVVTYLYSPFIL